MQASLSWLRVEERLTASLLLFIRNINVLKITNCLHSQLTHSSDTHTYPTRHATRGLFIVPKSRTNSIKRTVLYRALIAWNFLPSHIAQINSKPGLKKQINQHLAAQPLFLFHLDSLRVCIDMQATCAFLKMYVVLSLSCSYLMMFCIVSFCIIFHVLCGPQEEQLLLLQQLMGILIKYQIPIPPLRLSIRCRPSVQ